MTRLSTPAILSVTALTLTYSVSSVILYLSTRSSSQTTSSYKASSAVAVTEFIKIILCTLFTFLNGELRLVGYERKRLRIEREEVEDESELMELIAKDTLKKVETKELQQKLPPVHPTITLEKRRKSVNSEGVLTPRTISYNEGVVSAKGCRVSIIPPTPSTNDTPAVLWDDSNLYPGRIALTHRNSIGALSPSYLTLLLDLLDFDMWYSLVQAIFSTGWWKLGVPAILFVFQANAQYLASSNLSVPTFQLAYQLKIPATALASVIVLKRSLSAQQWASLVTLTLGVGIVQSSQTPHTSVVKLATAENITNAKLPNHVLGLTAVILACISSGFASTYFEKVLKTAPPSPNSPPPPSVWIRNIQLSLFGLIVLIPVIYFDHSKSLSLHMWDETLSSAGWLQFLTGVGRIGIESFFEGFDSLTWIVISLQVIGGLLGGLVVAYADNILKVFSTSLSVVISCIASVYFFNFQPTLAAVFGASLVLLSTYVYALPTKRST